MSGGPIEEQYQEEPNKLWASAIKRIPSQEVTVEEYYWLRRDAFIPGGAQGDEEAEDDSDAG